MRIATWNVERLKHKKDLSKILNYCEEINANILVLTETDEQINPNYKYIFQTPKLSEIDSKYYKATENRISIFTKYKLVKQYQTYDKYTSLCIELETENGNLIVYGTIIGIYGNRDKYGIFNRDLLRQIDDFKRLSDNKNICICGDFNCSFSDNYYFTYFGRNALNESFLNNEIELLTKNQNECIDHIAISKKFISNCNIEVQEWNLDKKLSDHKGIFVDLIFI
ncbi:MAG: endonuclease/exonuclease/phosphatase family protein [Selenomonadaceae bacterium]|nr:endonuclease/exonuclease/phosphatase family protein [Selenomonadaceae bacterium]